MLKKEIDKTSHERIIMTKEELLKKIKAQKHHEHTINLSIKINKSGIKIYKGFIEDIKKSGKKSPPYLLGKDSYNRDINDLEKDQKLNNKLLKETKQKIKTLEKMLKRIIMRKFKINNNAFTTSLKELNNKGENTTKEELLKCDCCGKENKNLWWYYGNPYEFFCEKCINDDLSKVEPEYYKELQEGKARLKRRNND